MRIGNHKKVKQPNENSSRFRFALRGYHFCLVGDDILNLFLLPLIKRSIWFFLSNKVGQNITRHARRISLTNCVFANFKCSFCFCENNKGSICYWHTDVLFKF